MFERVLAIIIKEWRELVRDPVYLGLSFIVPILLLLLFGYGLMLDVKHLPLVFLNADPSPVSRDYIDRYVHSEYFDLIAVTTQDDEAAHLLKTGDARVVIELPSDFTRRITAQEPVAVGVTIDGSFPSRGEIIEVYVTVINGLYNQDLLAQWLATRGMTTLVDADTLLPVSMNMSVWYNPALESKNFIVPGMIVLIMMIFPALLGSLLIVRERESGTIFNFFASPVKRWEIIAGKALPYIGVAFTSFMIMFAMSLWLFQVRFIGSIPVLFTGALLYSICTIGIGMLISVITRSQLAAMLMTFIFTVTPAFNYSGFMAPIASQDAVGQFVAGLIPATYFMDVLRGTYLKGLGFDYYWPGFMTLALYSVLVYGLTGFLLKKKID